MVNEARLCPQGASWQKELKQINTWVIVLVYHLEIYLYWEKGHVLSLTLLSVI